MSAWIVSKKHIDYIVSAAMASFGPAHPDKTAFFKAMDDNPNDEATRAVFADWCEENGRMILAARLRAGEAASPNAIGRMLWRENVVSVAYRYSDGTVVGESEWASSYADVKTYTWTPTAILSGAALYKTIGCYEYQSCEHDEWKSSEAHKLAKQLIPVLDKEDYDDLLATPGYEETPWGWGDPAKDAAALRTLKSLGLAKDQPRQRKPRVQAVVAIEEIFSAPTLIPVGGGAYYIR